MSDAITRVIDLKPLDVRKSSSLSVDVLAVVQRWIQNPSSNYDHFIVVKVYSKKKPKMNVRLKRAKGRRPGMVVQAALSI